MRRRLGRRSDGGNLQLMHWHHLALHSGWKSERIGCHGLGRVRSTEPVGGCRLQPSLRKNGGGTASLSEPARESGEGIICRGLELFVSAAPVGCFAPFSPPPGAVNNERGDPISESGVQSLR